MHWRKRTIKRDTRNLSRATGKAWRGAFHERAVEGYT